MCSCHSIPECCVMFSGVKLSMGSFVLFIYHTHTIHESTKHGGRFYYCGTCKNLAS